ncbi:MAG: hypothetical protein HYU41_27525, partial [Candidatus Rokubacteria bacterium]|nr:hypothetical protein [Candidatus Rokubacteria bacterium]
MTHPSKSDAQIHHDVLEELRWDSRVEQGDLRRARPPSISAREDAGTVDVVALEPERRRDARLEDDFTHDLPVTPSVL